jgi:hypothetical protein
MTKQRNIQYFTAKVNGREYEFRCYTTWTRNGFCHTAQNRTYDVSDTKQSYINRTWERFDYETVLKRAIDKLRTIVGVADEVVAEIYAQIIEGKAVEEHEKAEAMFKSFEALHSALSDENKERLAESDIEIRSEDDAKAVMGLMALMSLTQK